MFHPIASRGASPAARKGDAPGGDVEIWGRFYGNIWEYMGLFRKIHEL